MVDDEEEKRALLNVLAQYIHDVAQQALWRRVVARAPVAVAMYLRMIFEENPTLIGPATKDLQLKMNGDVSDKVAERIVKHERAVLEEILETPTTDHSA